MDHCSVSWEITLLYFFSWNCTWFGQTEPIKVQNFRLSTADVKFSQNLYFDRLLKVYKILAKKHREVMSHDPEDRCTVWRKTNLLFQKWQEFDEIWTEQLQVSKTCTFICSNCAKYLMFDLKKYRGVIFHDTEGWCKIWRKINLWFGKWHEEYGIFSPEHLKVSKLGFWWDPLIQKSMSRKSRKSMNRGVMWYKSIKSAEELCVMTINNDAKFEEELACLFKTDMRNLMNFDLSTWKSQKFSF